MVMVEDIATTTYYLIQGDYEAAAFSSFAIVVPFASGKFLQNGRYLAKLGHLSTRKIYCPQRNQCLRGFLTSTGRTKLIPLLSIPQFQLIFFFDKKKPPQKWSIISF